MPPLPLIHPPQSAKARLKVQEQDLKALNWEHEVLEQRFKQVNKLANKQVQLPN